MNTDTPVSIVIVVVCVLYVYIVYLSTDLAPNTLQKNASVQYAQCTRVYWLYFIKYKFCLVTEKNEILFILYSRRRIYFSMMFIYSVFFILWQ